LDENGLKITAPTCYLKKHDKRAKSVAVRHGNAIELLDVVYHDAYQKKSTNIDMTVIRAKGGIQFAGYMMHAGADNVSRHTKKSLDGFKTMCADANKSLDC
jgi:hypothetical protein